MPSRFLSEVPAESDRESGRWRRRVPQVDLHGRALPGAAERAAQHFHRQDLQLAGEYLAVLRRARRAVSGARSRQRGQPRGHSASSGRPLLRRKPPAAGAAAQGARAPA